MAWDINSGIWDLCGYTSSMMRWICVQCFQSTTDFFSFAFVWSFLHLDYIFDLVNILDYENISHFIQRCSHQCNQPDEKRNIWIPIKSALIDMRLDTLQVRVLWAWKEIWKKTYLDANAVRDVQEKLSLIVCWKRYFKNPIIIIKIWGYGISIVKRDPVGQLSYAHLLYY